MKKICITLLFSGLFVQSSNGQTLIQKIEDAYNTLDSTSYIEDVILSFKKVIERQEKEMKNGTLELFGFDPTIMDSVRRQSTLDSIDSLHKNSIHFGQVKTWTIEERTNMFRDRVKAEPPIYVLNLTPREDQSLQVDTGKLAFNLFYLSKHVKDNFYVFVDNEYTFSGNEYPTFSRPVAKNLGRVLRRVLRKRPKYLLFSAELEGMNTILYVLSDKVFVYRIAQMREYELSDYAKAFGLPHKN